MRKRAKDSTSSAKKLLGQLGAEKKRAVTALCLIVVMAFMWIRVLTKKGPEGTEARSVTSQERAEDQLSPESRVIFIELPKVAGRNDEISRDFFASDGWKRFVGREGQTNIEAVNIVSKDGSEEVIRKVAEKLKLQAIGLGENPRALVNDSMLSVGDTVLVRDGVDMYECEVIEIRENAVVMKCREAKITLKLVDVTGKSG